MTTTLTQYGIPAVEFPIAPPPARYPVIGKYDAGRIVPHEPRLEPWLTDDIVAVGDTVWRVTDEGRKRGGRDITDEYNAMIDRAGMATDLEQLADLDATHYDASPAGQS